MSVYSVSVYPSSTTIKTGNWYYGAYAIVNASSNCNTGVRWYSNNTNVATVNASSGYIYAKAPGTTRIYAQSTVDSSKKDYITVTVTSGTICVDSVTLNRSSISLEKGDRYTLSATVCPTNATNKSISWRSSNTGVATVSGGVVTAKARGYAYIYAEAQDGSGEYDSCYVNVTEDILVTSVTVSPSSKTMNIGNSAYLYETVCPTNATNKCVKWSSNKTSVATVNPDTGLVIAQGAGTATITATAQDGSNTKGYCTITVNPPVAVTGVEVCPQTKTLNIGQTTKLNATVCPIDATNKRVTWCSSNEDVACVNYYTGEIYANDVGTAIITATTEDGDFTSCGTVTVCSTDPFHHSNVEYVRIKKWRSVKTTNGINYTECDMSTTATKSYIDDLTYFTVFFPDEDEITTFEINDTLINQLNNIESQYQSQFFKQGRPLCFHKGKEYADGFVSEGKIEYASPEYYGIWAYNGNAVCEINDRLSFAFALATTAYSGFMYGFTKVMSLQSMQMTAGQTKTYTNSQYMDVVESQRAIADISDDVAVQLGKTDITSSSTARRTWRASEMRVAEDFPMSDGFQYNKSYKIVDGKLTQVSHGTAGSQRPDFYNPSTNQIIEVKNYTVTTQAGRNSLANNIATQYNNRKAMFPNASIEFQVDVYGQSYTQSMLEDIADLVSQLTGEDIVSFIYN